MSSILVDSCISPLGLDRAAALGHAGLLDRANRCEMHGLET